MQFITANAVSDNSKYVFLEALNGGSIRATNSFLKAEIVKFNFERVQKPIKCFENLEITVSSHLSHSIKSRCNPGSFPKDGTEADCPIFQPETETESHLLFCHYFSQKSISSKLFLEPFKFTGGLD